MTGLSADTISVLKATVPALEQKNVDITAKMYEMMFKEHPEVRSVFNQSHHIRDKDGKPGIQPRALAAGVLAYAKHCDNLGALTDTVNLMVDKHVSFDVVPEHYSIVGGCLLRAIKEVLGDAATDQIMEAWKNAYQFLADLLIGLESAKKEKLASSKDGWSGYKEMDVIKKVAESEKVTSFHLGFADGRKVPDNFEAGQYLGIKLPKGTFETPGDYDVVRNYTVSCAPNEGHFRISIKKLPRGASGQEGLVSNHFHDSVEVGSKIKVIMPCGDFVLKNEKKLIFIAAGVGITPLMSMMRWMANDSTVKRSVILIRVTQSSKEHPWKDEIDDMVGKTLDESHVFYTRGSGNDGGLKNTKLHQGRLTGDALRNLIPGGWKDEAGFYFCGPRGFMKSLTKMLDDLQVPKSQQHSEVFGPNA